MNDELTAKPDVFTAEQNLAYIREVMDRAKRKTSQAGPFLAGWGTASALVTLLQYLALIEIIPIEIMPYFWGAFGIVGGIASGIYGRKMERDNGTSSLAETVTTMLFSCVGITLGMYFAGVILGVAFGYIISFPAAQVCAVISTVMAIAFFVSSYSTGIKWFRLVAYGWWFALLLFIFDPFMPRDTLLLIAILDFCLLALPGFKLMSITKHDSQ